MDSMHPRGKIIHFREKDINIDIYVFILKAGNQVLPTELSAQSLVVSGPSLVQTSEVLGKDRRWTSLMVQWLRLRLPTQGVRVQSLVWELWSHKLWDVAKKKKKSRAGVLYTEGWVGAFLLSAYYALTMALRGKMAHVHNLFWNLSGKKRQMGT